MITRKGRQRVRRALSVMVVVLYGVGMALPGVVHAFVHAHETTVAHTPAQEQDPCHRMLYHGDTAACDHDAHLTDSDKCSLCDVVCHAAEAIIADVVVSHGTYTQHYFDGYKQRLDSYWAVLSSSRAPPTDA